MSQCSTRKRRSSLRFLLTRSLLRRFELIGCLFTPMLTSLMTFIAGVFFLSIGITGCTLAELKEAVTDGEQSLEGSAATPNLRFKRSDEPEVLRPSYIIRGGKLKLGNGAIGEFARMIVGGDGQQIKFIKPVAVGGYGDFLYVVDSGDGEPAIYRYNLADQTITVLGVAGQQLKGESTNIYVEPDLSFYITDPVGKRVLYFDEQGNLIRQYSDLVNLSRPIDVMVDDLTGNVYVADGSFSHVVIFSKLGVPLSAVGSRGTGPGKFRAITAITKGKNNSIFITDRLELPVQELGLDPGTAGRFRFSLGEGDLIWPTAIALDKEQRVYVSDKSDNTIRVYDDIRLIATVGGSGAAPGRFRLITDMWMSKEQKLYVADSLNKRVQVFDVIPQDGLNLDIFKVQ